jgi:murein DD-endopeptidase
MPDQTEFIKAAYLRELAVRYAWTWIGTPYKWGGDDFSSFDCSGLIVEVLQGIGILPHGRDYSAHDLYTIFKSNIVELGYAGCLAFWFDAAGHAVHVMLMVDDMFAIGADGGGSRTITTEDAIRQNAFIKIRPLDYRKGPRIIVDPFKGVF